MSKNQNKVVAEASAIADSAKKLKLDVEPPLSPVRESGAVVEPKIDSISPSKPSAAREYLGVLFIQPGVIVVYKDDNSPQAMI